MGQNNRVSFDASKEHMIILHPSECHGEAFKLLGCMMDINLRMHSAIDHVLSKIRPKITAILRTRGYYATPDLILQFKMHIWSLIEGNMGGYFHAAASLLEKIDDAQNRFIRDLGLSIDEAFLIFNFPPPSLRRNIGILGLLHKRVLGKCHPSFETLLPWQSDQIHAEWRQRHSKQLYGHNMEITHHQAIFNRSIFSMVDIYNNLAQHVVDISSVSDFQKYLMQVVRTRCENGDPEWSLSFSRIAECNFQIFLWTRCTGLKLPPRFNEMQDYRQLFTCDKKKNASIQDFRLYKLSEQSKSDNAGNARRFCNLPHLVITGYILGSLQRLNDSIAVSYTHLTLPTKA